MTHVNQFNYLAIQLLERIGILDPSQEQIDLIEELLARPLARGQLHFNHGLNSQEIACLYWAARGKSSKETAKLIDLNRREVESLRKEVKRKLHANSIAQAVFEGIRHACISALPEKI